MAFVFSDFLVEEPVYQRALEMLRARKLDVWAIHVIGRFEREIEGLRGRLRLRDTETGSVREVSITETDRRRYRRDFAEQVARLRRFCHQRGVGHVVAQTELGIGDNLVNAFAAQGLLRLR
jgi:hypothetical protein